MESILLDTMYDLPSMEDIEEIRITDDVVNGKAEPLRVAAGGSGGGKKPKKA